MTAPTSETAPSRPRCAALNAEGEPCGQDTVDPATGYCLFHDPSRREEAAEARARGGVQQGANKRAARAEVRTVAAEELPGGGQSPQTLGEVATWFGWLTVQLATGRLDYRVGREVGHALTGYRTALEKKDLLAKVGTLQAKLDAATGKRRRGAAIPGEV